MKNLKEKIKSGETVHGCWINLASTVSAEMIGRAGFDWVLIDLEHGAGNDMMMYQQLQVLEGGTATPLVRTEDLARPKVQRILDAGAFGVMFPQIQSAEEATLAVRAIYYPPKGNRGVATMVRATAFGKNADAYMRDLEKNIVGIVQIESVSAVEQAEAIAAIDGVDVLFIGPADLTMALGIFGQLNHPSYQNAIKKVADAAKKNGKACGVLLLDIGEYEMYYNYGYRFLACGADGAFVSKGAADMVKMLEARRKGE